MIFVGSIENGSKKNKSKKRQIDKISLHSEFIFDDEGVVVKKQSLIGDGQKIPLKKMKPTAYYKCQLYRSDGIHDVTTSLLNNPTLVSLLKPQRETSTPYKAPGTISMEPLRQDDIADQEENLSQEGEPALFSCPNSACTREFLSTGWLKNHINNGVCAATVRSQTQVGMMKVMYFR